MLFPYDMYRKFVGLLSQLQTTCSDLDFNNKKIMQRSTNNANHIFVDIAPIVPPEFPEFFRLVEIKNKITALSLLLSEESEEEAPQYPIYLEETPIFYTFSTPTAVVPQDCNIRIPIESVMSSKYESKVIVDPPANASILCTFDIKKQLLKNITRAANAMSVPFLHFVLEKQTSRCSLFYASCNKNVNGYMHLGEYDSSLHKFKEDCIGPKWNISGLGLFTADAKMTVFTLPNDDYLYVRLSGEYESCPVVAIQTLYAKSFDPASALQDIDGYDLM